MSVLKKEHLKLVEKVSKGKDTALKEQVRRIVKEEFDNFLEGSEKMREEIEKKLEGLRKTLIDEGKLSLREKGSGRNDVGSLPERRIPIQTVSELIDVPINMIILHFLNGPRVHEGHTSLVEYYLGEVFFYALPKEYRKVK